MTKLSVLTLTLLAFLFVPVACKVKTHSIPQIEGSVMLSDEKTTWGYGCGDSCSFNSDSSLNTAISFKKSNSVEMNMSGRLMNVIHYPSSFILDAKKWVYDYSGTWQDLNNNEVRLKLKLSKSECSLQRSEGKKKRNLPCEGLRKSIGLVCRAEEMTIQDLPKHAFICEDDEKNQTVFGIRETITKIVVGEPSIKTHFYTNK